MISEEFRKDMEFFANVGTIIAGIGAVFAVWLTARQLHETAELQQEQLAVTMFSEYAKQAYEVSKDPEAFAIFVQHTAESIYLLHPNDVGWKATARGLLSDNKAALTNVKDWHCDAWAPAFFDFAVTTLPELCCERVPEGRKPPACKK